MVIGLVRHGQTDGNAKGEFMGRNNQGLNASGRNQCKWIKSEVNKTEYDLCISSPLLRTFETAMILVGDTTLILKDDRLIERGLGDLEGKSYDLYDTKKYWDYNLNSNDEGIESIQDLSKRATEFLNYLQNNFSDKKILIVSHAATIRVLHHLLINTDFKKENLDIDIPNCYYRKYKLDNIIIY
jgi:broad specificity phosphatase PhoE